MADKIEKSINDDSGNFYNEGIPNLPNVDLIPYTCYLDEKTILTENGELLQIIKIPSFLEVKGDVDTYSLREKLNEIFLKNKNNKNVNFYFQTIRKKVNLIPKNDVFNCKLAETFINKWNKTNNWENQYANEIYISIIVCPVENKTGKFFEFIKAISFAILKQSKIKELKKMQTILNNCSTNFLNELKSYEAEMLKIKKIEGSYYSEHLTLFNLIINNDKENIKLPINDLSESIIRKKIIYETNAIKTFNNNEESYHSMLSIKYCNKLLLSQLDKIIQLNQEMVITQTITYVESKPLNDVYQEYIEKLSINEDSVMLNLSGFADVVSPPIDSQYSSIMSQLTIQIKGKTKEELENNLKSIIKVVRKIGLVAVREEMFLPTLFWSQLPGNFNFLKRLHIIPEGNVCSFTSLYNFPIGKMSGNCWGDCTLILKSALETPYFLPLHYEKNGNIFIMGPKNVNKTKFLNFLLLSALKQAEKIYYIDNTNRSNVFVNSIGGDYYFITKRNAKFRLTLNPFSMAKNDENSIYLLKWLKFIIFQVEDGMVKMGESSTNLEEEWKKFEQQFRTNYSSINVMTDVIEIAKNNNLKVITKSLKKWGDPENFGMIFNEKKDIFDLGINNILGLNLSSIINNDLLRSVIIDYILYRIIKSADGKRTILAIDESWIMLDNPLTAPKFVDILKELYTKNVILMVTTSGSDSFEHSNLTISVKNLFATHIILPNLKMTVYQKKVFAIMEEEVKIASIMQENRGTFLLKNGKNILISSFDFSCFDAEEILILNGINATINIMNKAKELINSEKSSVWLPLFFLLLKEYSKKKREQKIKEQEQRQLRWEEAKQGDNNNNKILHDQK